MSLPFRDLAYVYNAADNSHNVSFTMLRNGVSFPCTDIKTGAPADSLSIAFAEYDNATRTFNAPLPLNQLTSSGLSLGSQTTLVNTPGTNLCTSKVFDNVVQDNVVRLVGNLALRNGIIELNGRDDGKARWRHLPASSWPCSRLRLYWRRVRQALITFPPQPSRAAKNATPCLTSSMVSSMAGLAAITQRISIPAKAATMIMVPADIKFGSFWWTILNGLHRLRQQVKPV